MPKALSLSENKKLLAAVDRGLSVRQVAEKFERSEKTIRSLLRRRDTGQDLELKGRTGIIHEGRKFNTGLHTLLQYLLEENETLSLQELAGEVQFRAGIVCTPAEVSKALAEVSITRKQLTSRATEADPARRSQFSWYLNTFHTPEQLVYIDESSCDQQTSQPRHGWAGRGDRTHTRLDFARGKRLTVIGACSHSGMLTWYIREGAACAEDILVFGQHCLIECCWGQMKAFLRKWYDWVQLQEPCVAIDRALQEISPTACRNYIQQSLSLLS